VQAVTERLLKRKAGGAKGGGRRWPGGKPGEKRVDDRRRERLNDPQILAEQRLITDHLHGGLKVGLQIQHMVAARLTCQRIAAVRHVRGDDDQIARIKGERLAVAGATSLPLQDSANGQLRMAVKLVGLGALPGAAQFNAGLTAEGLIDVTGVGHSGYRRRLSGYSMSGEECRL